MIAIDNTKLISYTTGIGIPPVNLTLFIPAVTWSYNAGAKTLTTTDAATITGPDTFSKCNVAISDNQGLTVYGAITTATGNTGAVDVSSLNLAGPLTVKVTESSTKGVQCTGQSDFINAGNATGSIGFWEVTASTAE